MSNRKSAGRGAEILLAHQGELFMLLRDDKPGLAARLQWTVLAGVIEVGETDDEAMHREIMEEIGVPVAIYCLGRHRGYTWYTGRLDGWQAGAIRQGEGCARGFFSYAALVALSQVEGKGGLGGTILQIMKNSPDALRAFLASGTHPDVNTLMSG